MKPRAFSLAVAALGLIALAALCAPWLASQDPHDLAQLSLAHARLAPFEAAPDGRWYLLGTDDQGRDMTAAILYGLRTSLGVGLSATLAALAIGLIGGLGAALLRGWPEALILRLVDLQLSFPAILVAIVLIATLGEGTGKVVSAVVIAQWAYYARTARAVARVEIERGYVAAARGLALPQWRIVLFQLIPNCLPPMLAVATVQMAAAISLEATLSFLGLGVPLTRPSLGLLIANGAHYVFAGQYWMSLAPGVALLALILSIQCVGEQWVERLGPQGQP